MTVRGESRKLLDLVSGFAESLLARRRGESRNGRLVILDDAFPSLLSSFRIAEYNAYLEAFPGSEVHSSGGSFRAIGEHRAFEAVRRDYAAVYPHLGNRVIRFHRNRPIEGCFSYMTFLANARGFLPFLRKNGIPFAFTLYPGGGFRLEQAESDRSLREVFDSEEFRRVIVTQKITRDYLINGHFVEPARIEFVYGCVLPAETLCREEIPRRRFRESKATFDICFVAFKYMSRGRDKGYDLFIETARLLARRSGDFRFHVVGPFGPDDVDVSDIGSRIVFHGMRDTSFFPAFYSGMEVILSPNVPFVLSPGAFDGFPTGACAEAGICGVAVFCTDVLGQNVRFRDGEEIVIVPPDPGAIAEAIWEHHGNPDVLHRLGRKGKEAFRETFDLSRQMEPRLRAVAGCLPGLAGGT